jgi:Xaa-Pro aminopeptidase
MEEASAVAEAVTETALTRSAPGILENEFAADAMPYVVSPRPRDGGRGDAFRGLRRAHAAAKSRLCTDKIIREGDLVFIDLGATWSGYVSDVGRTIICGKPRCRQQEIHTAVF